MFSYFKFIIISMLLSLSICSSEYEEYDEFETEYEMEEEDLIYDPLEPINRIIFSFNDIFDKTFFRPLASAYRKFVPKWPNRGINNVVNMFFSPIRFVNFTLQGDVENAAKTIARFMFNLVFGFFGVCDAAKVVGLTPTKNTNFGETLKKWGAKPGPYIVLPFIGPTSFRGGIGTFVDLVPIAYLCNIPIHKNKYIKLVRYTMNGTNMLLTRVSLLDVMDDLGKLGLDPYITTKSAIMEKEK